MKNEFNHFGNNVLPSSAGLARILMGNCSKRCGRRSKLYFESFGLLFRAWMLPPAVAAARADCERFGFCEAAGLGGLIRGSLDLKFSVFGSWQNIIILFASREDA